MKKKDLKSFIKEVLSEDSIVNEYSVYQGDVSQIKPYPTPKEGEMYLKDLKSGDKFSPISSYLEYIVVKSEQGNSGVEVKYADGTGNMRFRGNVLVKKTNMDEAKDMFVTGGSINPELRKKVEQFVKGIAKDYDYSVNDAFLAIMTILKGGIAKEGVNEDIDLGHEDNEPHMIKGELYRIGKYAMELYQMVDKFEGKGEVDFPAWWQAKVTTSMNNMVSAKHYLDFELKEPAIDNAVDTLNEADSANARGVAIAFEKDILDPMEFGTDANERFPLILKYIEDNEIKGIDPEEVVVELNKLMDVNEKKLTTAEKNKKEEIVKSMKKDFKGPKAAMYAIATDKAKKMAETIAKKLKSK